MNNALKNLVRCVICIMYMMLSSLASHADDFPKFPYSKDMDVVVVAQEMIVNGVRMRAYQFTSNKGEDHVVDFYNSEWGDEMTDVVFGDWRILSHKEDDFLMTVQIEQGDHPITHGTLGITPAFELANMNSGQLSKIESKVGMGFPMLANSKVVSDITSNDQGRMNRTLIFTNSRSVRQNIEFYLNRLGPKGWEVLGSKSRAKRGLNALALNKGDEQLNLSFVRKDHKTYGVAVKSK